MWSGYRNSEYQKEFEDYLDRVGFMKEELHTSGHASISDIQRVIAELDPKQIIPIHTMAPNSFIGLFSKVVLKEDDKALRV